MAKTDNKEKQRIRTPKFRVAFPHVFKPSAIKNSKADPKYSVTMLFKKSQDLAPLKAAMKAAKVEAFGADKSKWPTLSSPVVDGDDADYADYEGYKGHWVIKATSSQDFKPTVVDEDVEEIIEPGKFYPGCYAVAQVFARVHADYGNGQGVHFILDMIQKVADGKPFGGKKNAKDVFSPVEGAQEEEGEEEEEEDF